MPAFAGARKMWRPISGGCKRTCRRTAVSHGCVRLLQVTEKQYGRMRLLVGDMPVMEKEAATQLLLF